MKNKFLMLIFDDKLAGSHISKSAKIAKEAGYKMISHNGRVLSIDHYLESEDIFKSFLFNLDQLV